MLQCFGLEKGIEIIHGNDPCLKELDWDMGLVAALAEPKARIFQTLREVLKDRRDVPVIFRTYIGMRAVWYEPVHSSDIKEILPTRRIYEKGLRQLLDDQSVFDLPPEFKEYLRIRPKPPVNNKYPCINFTTF